jgi:RNA polymerase sigma-70 factor (ECF subfamily)
MRPSDLPRIANEPAVFEDFYREHIEVVQGFIARRVGDPHLAADLTAETFLAAIDAAPTYRTDRGKPRSWLFGIALNVVNAEYRRAGRERRAGARVQGRRLLDPDDVARLRERIDAAARSRELYAALDQLSEGERAVFELHALDDLSPGEAAAVLGIHPVTARVRLHRARVTLRRQLCSEEIHPATTPSMEA